MRGKKMIIHNVISEKTIEIPVLVSELARIWGEH